MTQPIEFVRGTTNCFEVALKDPDGNAVQMQEGEKLIFGVKSNKNNAEYDLKKIITMDSLVDGAYVVRLDPEDTIDLPFGNYYYDVGFQTEDAYYMVVECSPFILSSNITQKED